MTKKKKVEKPNPKHEKYKTFRSGKDRRVEDAQRIQPKDVPSSQLQETDKKIGLFFKRRRFVKK